MVFPALHRIWAVVVRHAYVQKRDVGRILDLIFWPLVDIVMFGFVAVWLTQGQTTLTTINVSLPLTGAIFWQVVQRVNLDIVVHVLEEIWQQNLFNLFITPLRVLEWIVSLLLVSIARGLFILLYCGLLIYLVFGFNLLSLGFILIPTFFLLVIVGWIFGLIGATCIFYWGPRIQSIAWALGWFFAPFCAVYYPVSILPIWMQSVSKCLPMTYIFEGLRSFMMTGTYPSHSFLIACISLILCLSVILMTFFCVFRLSKIHGLAKLERG